MSRISHRFNSILSVNQLKLSTKTSNNTLSDSQIFQNEVADIIEIPFFVCAIIFCCVYLVITLTKPNLRSNGMSWLTANVCIATILFAIEQLGSIVTFLTWPSDSQMTCRLRSFILRMGAFHLMYAFCVASICRLLSIRYFHKNIFRSNCWLLGSVISGWILGLVSALPFLFFNNAICLFDKTGRMLELYACITIGVLPLTIVTVCNILTFQYVRSSNKRITTNSSVITKFDKRDVHLCKAVLFSFCTSFMGTAPITVERLCISYKYHIPLVLSTFIRVLPSISVLASITLFIYLNQMVRRTIMERLRCNGKVLYIF